MPDEHQRYPSEEPSAQLTANTQGGKPHDAESTPSSWIGRRVGHCRLLSHVSRGGMGDVFAAEHLYLSRNVAIKLPRIDAGGAFFNQQRLLHEARHLAKVAHVNVVSVHDLGFTSAGLAYLVMELLGGDPLDQILERTPFLGLPEALHVVRELARGVHACHRADVLICDVKPENVMVVGGPLIGFPPQGTVWTKIIDLGVAQSIQEARRPKEGGADQWMGTPAYASPELIRGDALSPASDVYSLGVLFYELIAGQVPFTANNIKDQLQLHLLADPKPLSYYRPEIKAESPLERLVEACLAKDPASRPQNMVSFLNHLDQAARQALVRRSGDEALCGDLRPRQQAMRQEASTVPMTKG